MQILHKSSEYHREIIDLSNGYEWRQALLPLAIEYHTARGVDLVEGGMGVSW